MGEFAIGQGVARFEDPRLIQGGGRYVDDIKLPGMAYGVVLRSQHAHAKINSLDISAAKAAPGVLAVLTAADVKAAGWNDIPVPGGLKRRDGSPMYKPRYPILADTYVRWVGDYVAFVVAETQAQALDAAEMIAVDYDELPAVTATEDAAKPDAPRVWAGAPDNICFVELIGDKARTDEAFANAAHVVEGKFVINRVTAATMEPRGAVGDYHAAEDRYTIYTALQRPHPTRADLAKMMNVSESKVRAVTGDTGGSFGMKSPIFNETPLVLLASKITGRPVKWISTRTESFLSDAQARDNVTEAELALDKDGVFLGFRVKTIAAIGAYLQQA
ncbi:MAG TPA: molybdopterin cofactor-binding domain-containing protein, partial [Pseudolabrys sp.]